MPFKLVLLVRADLGMGRGKIAAQAAHAAVAAVLGTPDRGDLIGWFDDDQPKVVLRVDSEEQLRDVARAAVDAGLPVELILDAGRTQIAAGTATAAAIGPATDARIDAVTGSLRLL
ncbi:MAG TPA: peptidyl-tRNA hydrolase Pth2 [Micromonosporaceae bacterium]|jgi:PTH2 family peptidyl-tRNA hydrolase